MNRGRKLKISEKIREDESLRTKDERRRTKDEGRRTKDEGRYYFFRYSINLYN